MNAKEFNNIYMCNFETDPRDAQLYEKLKEYYRLTPDSVSNVVAGKQYRKFHQWAKSCGYTQEEINRAKRIISERAE